MKSKLFFIILVGFICACKSEADQSIYKKNNIELYYSYKICKDTDKCKELTPTSKGNDYLFKKLNPPYDEFYLKNNNGDYYLYYKNIYSEDVQIGWAKAQATDNNHELILEIKKINLALGGIDFIKNGYADKQAESKNFKSGIYYLNENYQGSPYDQKQKIIFKKKSNDLILDCDSYLNNTSVKNNFYGIFYGICSEGEKVYFKKI